MSQKIKDFDMLDVRVGVFNIRNLKHIDWMTSIIVLALASIGLALLYSADRSIESTIPYWSKQSLFLGMGVLVALFLLCVDSRFLVSIAPVLYLGAILLLGAVILLGHESKGGQRWLALGPLRLQPSEQTKLITILSLTWYLTLIKERIRKLHYLLLTFLISGIPAVLILKQPSLGTAMSIMPITLVMVFVAGCRWWHLAAFFIAGLVAIQPVYNHLKPYQKERVDAFLNLSVGPEENDIKDDAPDPEGTAESNIDAEQGKTLEQNPLNDEKKTGETQTRLAGWWQKLRAIMPFSGKTKTTTETPAPTSTDTAGNPADTPKSEETTSNTEASQTADEKSPVSEEEAPNTADKKKDLPIELKSLWQTLQSMITIGSGGLTGKGYLKGTQTMLNYLPEHHTDFIFSVLAEEEGFAGGVLVLGLYAAFLLRGLKIALESKDMTGALLASGIVTMFAFHIYVNIAITIGLMPVTGIPLPFLSYGGSFYITSMMAVGVLLNVPVRKQLFD